MRISLLSLVGTLLLGSLFARAEEPLVFISAFAGGDKAGIHAFHFDGTTGTLKPVHRTTDINQPFFLAVSKDKRFLYATHAKQFGGGEESVVAYALEGRGGELKRLNDQPSQGKATCYVEVDATGKAVMVANYSSGSVAAYPVGSDGMLGKSSFFEQHTGTGLDPVRQKGPNAHSIVVSPDNRFALSADLGIDKVLIYTLDAATAHLAPHPTQPFVKMTPGAGPRHITFHPNGKHFYVINELNETVTVFDYDTSAGTLTERQNISTLPADFKGNSACADLKITPDGHFLYGTNRGHDSIAAYRIADDGKLTLLAIHPSLGKGPQNLLITPDGQWLLCANMPGNSVIVFKIDAQTGDIKATGTSVEMPMPSCIRMVE